MSLLIFGVVIFFSVHLAPSFVNFRQSLVNRLGENLFRGIYVASSVVGMLSIIVGKAIAVPVWVWSPPMWGRQAAVLLMLPALILFTALLLPTNIKRLSRHPMLWGISIWSVAHLLANGDLGSIILFGGFGGYSLYSMWSLNRRGAKKSDTKFAVVYDLLVIAVGVSVYALIAFLHPYLFGVPAIM